MENSIIIQNLSTDVLYEKIRSTIREELSLTQQNITSKYLTRQEAASLLRITLPTLHEYTKAGIIHASRIGTRVLYAEDDILTSVKEIPVQKYKRR